MNFMTPIAMQDQTNPRKQNIVLNLMTQHWPLWIALAALWICTGVLQYFAALRTEGHLIYSLDDAYIHMAMAKNLAHHGVYGVTRYEFSSSSSSPVWTLIVALFYLVFGVRDTIPFVLNVIVSSLVLVAAYVLLTKNVKRHALLTFTLLAIVFFTPLPLLISIGMEHPLHILLVVLFIWLFGRTIVGDTSTIKTSTLIILILVCIALAMTRFESYALIAIVAILYAIRRRWKLALGILLASALPLFVYQAISVAHGWQWLPNSVLIRANTQQTQMFNSMEVFLIAPMASEGPGSFYTVGLETILHSPFLAILLSVSVVILIFSIRRTRQFWKFEHVLLVAYIAMALAHAQFGRIGHFFRYEAYLIAVGVFVLAFSIGDAFDALKQWMMVSRGRALAGSVVLLIAVQLTIPFFTRCFLALPLIGPSSQNIYQQQYQMGLFLQRYYDGKTVAANDIGAICYLADIHLVDLVGLGSVDIYQLRKSNTYDTERVQRLCAQRGVSLAVAYELWLQLGGMPGFQQKWKLAGRWKIPDNIVCGSDIVSFFSVDPSGEQQLKEDLGKFSRTLPRDVGFWVKPNNPSDTPKTSSSH